MYSYLNTGSVTQPRLAKFHFLEKECRFAGVVHILKIGVVVLLLLLHLFP